MFIERMVEIIWESRNRMRGISMGVLFSKIFLVKIDFIIQAEVIVIVKK